MALRCGCISVSLCYAMAWHKLDLIVPGPQMMTSRERGAQRDLKFKFFCFPRAPT